jgi:lysozyme
MEINKAGKDLIKRFEGCKLKAYKCPADVWTIGYGNTFYEDGTKVKEGDVITQERAEELFDIIISDFVRMTDALVKSDVTENNFSALVSFTFNVGTGNLKRSTLLRKVNANPKDPSIRAEFMKWTRANNVVLKGLVRRREAEAKLYEQL